VITDPGSVSGTGSVSADVAQAWADLADEANEALLAREREQGLR
jgi:hypothetical protein